jgi:serine/threonine protein kinase
MRGADGAMVTLRQLPREMLGDPEFLRRLRAEVPVVANLDPTYIVRTLAEVEDAFGIALVTDFVDGAALRSLLPSIAGQVEPTLVIVRDVLLGLEAAHRKGILHRDLGSEKVTLDRQGISRIGDLGLVARTPSRRWIPGTPEYMAPELWSGEEPSVAGDLYAAAVLLFECFRGAPPFRGGVVMLREQHLTAPPSVHDLPREVAALVLSGMARSPSARPPTAWDFALDVLDAGRTLGGPDWERRGRRHLAAQVTAALAPAADAEASPPRRLMGRARFRRGMRAPRL